MSPSQLSHTVMGAVGAIEVRLDVPTQIAPGRIAMVAHPHPLYGGTMDNKVAQTLARTLAQMGYVCARANFRGVGSTAGEHDGGVGETEDTLAVIRWLAAEYGAQDSNPIVLAGFSFGAFVQAQVAPRLSEANCRLERMVLVGTPAGKWAMPDVDESCIVIHGQFDETIPLDDVLTWAQPQELPVTVVAGADHFFHRRLTNIQRIMRQQWHFATAGETV